MRNYPAQPRIRDCGAIIEILQLTGIKKSNSTTDECIIELDTLQLIPFEFMN